MSSPPPAVDEEIAVGPLSEAEGPVFPGNTTAQEGNIVTPSLIYYKVEGVDNGSEDEERQIGLVDEEEGRQNNAAVAASQQALAAPSSIVLGWEAYSIPKKWAWMCLGILLLVVIVAVAASTSKPSPQHQQTTSKPTLLPTNKPTSSPTTNPTDSPSDNLSSAEEEIKFLFYPTEVAVAGDDGEPASAFPLGICQGDCDDDSDCRAGLVCAQRERNDPLPGCLFSADPNSSANIQEWIDLCIPTPIVRGQVEFGGNGGLPAEAFPLKICQSDCIDDDDCDEGLVCRFRGEANDQVSIYCSGSPFKDENYCVPAPGVVPPIPGVDIANLTGFPSVVGEESKKLDAAAILSAVGNTRTEINLGQSQLVGPLPSDLRHLTELTHLDLSENGLTGPLPSELGLLTALTLLNLWNNQLMGPLPSELGELTNLTTLSLSQNNLTSGIPPELVQLTNLTALNLWDNNLFGPLPSELGRLTKLTNLGLSMNQLSGGIPSGLGQLTALTRLALHRNQLTDGIPSEYNSIN